MAERNFLEQKQKQRYLILFLLAVVLLTLFIVWKGFLKKPSTPEVAVQVSLPPRTEINFEIFKNPLLQELQPFEEIKPLEGEKGRENPFIPY